jgi:hypothetical protein
MGAKKPSFVLAEHLLFLVQLYSAEDLKAGAEVFFPIVPFGLMPPRSGQGRETFELL